MQNLRTYCRHIGVSMSVSEDKFAECRANIHLTGPRYRRPQGHLAQCRSSCCVGGLLPNLLSAHWFPWLYVSIFWQGDTNLTEMKDWVTTPVVYAAPTAPPKLLVKVNCQCGTYISTRPPQLVYSAYCPYIKGACDGVNMWRKWRWSAEYGHFGNINKRLVTLLIRWQTWCIRGGRWKLRICLSGWLFGHIMRSHVCTRFPYLVLYIGIVCRYWCVQINRKHVIAVLYYIIGNLQQVYVRLKYWSMHWWFIISLWYSHIWKTMILEA